MSKENSVVAAYHTHTEADQAVTELQRGGVDLHKLSIVGKGSHTDEYASRPLVAAQRGRSSGSRLVLIRRQKCR